MNDLNTLMLYLLSASDRSATHQSSHHVEVSLSAFSGLNGAESDHTIKHQLRAGNAGSSADQQQPEGGATVPGYVLISKPGSLLKTQHQENAESSAAPLHLVAFPMGYPGSVDVFCQIHPNQLSNVNYPLAPLLVPLTYSGSNSSQIPESHAQRLNDAFLPDSIPCYLGQNPSCTQTPASCLPVFSVLPAQGLNSLHNSDSSFVQNKAPEASPDPVPVQTPAAQDIAVTEPPSFPPPAPERYIELWMIGPNRLLTIIIYFTLLPWSNSSPVTPLEGSTDLVKFESSGRLTAHAGDDRKLNCQATDSLKAAHTRFDLSPQHRCCTAILTLDAHEVNFSDVR